ncbi:MAG: hypothetical protein NVSMB27_12410 [Ktedonobacteraceae bacterium]
MPPYFAAGDSSYNQSIRFIDPALHDWTAVYPNVENTDITFAPVAWLGILEDKNGNHRVVAMSIEPETTVITFVDPLLDGCIGINVPGNAIDWTQRMQERAEYEKRRNEESEQ